MSQGCNVVFDPIPSIPHPNNLTAERHLQSFFRGFQSLNYFNATKDKNLSINYKNDCISNADYIQNRPHN
jgi:hypothetical protein